LPDNSITFLIANYAAIIAILRLKKLDNVDDCIHFTSLYDNQVSLFVEEELSEKFGRLIAFVKQTEAAMSAKSRRKLEEVKNASLAAASAAGGATTAPATTTTAPTTTTATPAGGDDKEDFKLDTAVVEAIVKHFAGFWKDGIDQLSSSVTKNFGSSSSTFSASSSNLNAIPDGKTAGGGGGGGGGGPDSDDKAGVGTEILKKVLVQLVLYYQRFLEILKVYYRNKQPPFQRDVVPIQTLMYEVKKYGNLRS